MLGTSFLGLLQDTVLLLAMAVLFDVAARRWRTGQSLFWQALVGLVLGIIGITVMLEPWTFIPGIVFDMRSVLLSISGLFFGTLPTALAMAMTAAFRFSQGGAGVWTGIAVILTSGALGIAWRHVYRKPLADITWPELYLFGIVIHAAMLATMLTLPWAIALRVLSNITVPVLLIYPVGTALLGTLMANRLRHERMENVLKESEERLRWALEGTNDGIWDVQMKTGEVYLSPRGCEILGYRPDEVEEVVKVWSDLVNPEDMPRTLEKLGAHLQGQAAIFHVEQRLKMKSGAWKWIDTRGKVVLRDSDGTPLRMTGTHTDITERKQAEEKIERQVMRLSALREIDLSIISTTDLQLTLKIVTEKVVALMTVAAADILLYNPSTMMLEYAAGSGFQGTAIERSRLRLGEGPAGRAALERRIVAIHNITEQEKEYEGARVFAAGAFTCYWGLPLIAKGELKGVLEIFTREHDPEWGAFLETLAGQSAIAIDNAQLFDGLHRSHTELRLAYDATIEGWSRAMELRDKETEGHTQRVTDLTLELGRASGMSDEQLTDLRRGALLHDMGKLGVPDSILNKHDDLTGEEWEIMKRHPTYAHEMLAPVTYLRHALDIPYCHHERWDGTGYPRGLQGEEIPLAARLFAIADIWDALRSDRPYRAAWPAEKVLNHIRSLSGTYFDPKAVELFLRVMHEQKNIIGS